MFTLLLSACGGGGDNGDTDSADVNILSNPTYTYDTGRFTVTETININSTGSIDLKDYLFPSQEGRSVLNYRDIYFFGGVEDFQNREDLPELFQINGDNITKNGMFEHTDYAIQSDRIRLKYFGEFTEPLRDSALGRLYEVGDEVYSAKKLETEITLDSNGNPTLKINKSCRISKAFSSLTYRGFSYTGDIIEFACSEVTSRTTTNSLGGEFISTFKRYETTYYKKDVGKVAMIEDNCNPNNDFVPSIINSSDCPDNRNTQSTYSFLVQ